MSIFKDHFLLLARYNHSTNDQMYGIVAGIDDTARKKQCGSYFGSMHSLLNHLLIGDILWLNRFHTWQTDSVVLQDPALHPAGLAWDHDLFDDFDELRKFRKTIDTLLEKWVDEMPEDRYTELVHYRDYRGNQRRYPAWLAMDHLFNHQTHHRGSVAQMLDELGIENDYSNITALQD